jgi:hypothetical protein
VRWYGAGGDVNATSRIREAIQVRLPGSSSLCFVRLRLYAPSVTSRRATYEAEDRRLKLATSTDAPRSTATINEVYDLSSAALQQGRAPTNPNAVMEFIVDCYTAMWQNILRNGRVPCRDVTSETKSVTFECGCNAGKDSMLTTTFRLFNRKRFSQRTNDMRARAILDFIAGITGSETADFLLYGRLIGLQPRQTAQPRPGRRPQSYWCLSTLPVRCFAVPCMCNHD